MLQIAQMDIMPRLSLSKDTASYILSPAVKAALTAVLSEVLEPLLGQAIKGNIKILGYSLGSFGAVGLFAFIGGYAVNLLFPTETAFGNQNDVASVAYQMSLDSLKIAGATALPLIGLAGMDKVGLLTIAASTFGAQYLGELAMGIAQDYLIDYT